MSQTYDLLDFHTRTQPESSSKYFGLSVMLHTALVVASFFVVVPAMENLKKEVITIELQPVEEKKLPPPVVLKTLAPAKGIKTKITRGSKRVLAPAPAALLKADASSVIAGPVQKSKKSVSKVAKIKTHTSLGKASVAKSAVSRAGIPETLEDIAAPDLDADTVAVAQVGNLGDNEFENDFKKVDHSNEAALTAERSQLDQEAKMIADEKDSALKALSDDNLAQSKAMEDALKSTRDKNAATLAQMKATERAAAEKAARDREKARLAAAALKNRGSGEETNVAGRGNGNEGADTASAERSGIPSGIRSLDQLKQMPGNPKPQYSNEERLKRHQGQVIFYAYVTTEGSPTQFRIAQSTGFRNLDGKTLAALKRWRFYPGQQGWVELPFKWDLKGGAQEMPTTLRRVGSR